MTRLRGRLAAAVVDQAFYSLQSFVVAFTALHVLALAELGAFSLATSLLILAQVALRALTGELLTIRFSASTAELRVATADAAGTAFAVAACTFAVSLALWAFGLGLRDVVSAATLALLALVVQDTYRFALFAAGRLWAATLNDGLVCAVTILIIWVVSVASTLSGTTLLLAWAAGSAAGAALGALQLQVLPRPRQSRRWLRRHSDIGLPLLGSVVAQQSVGRLSLVCVGALAGMAQLGLITASRTVLSPVNTLTAASYAFAVPEAVRRRERPAAMVRFTTTLGASLAAVAVVLTVILLSVPDEWGQYLAGRNWNGARALLPPTCLWIVGIALSQGARVGLKALERTDLLLRTSVGLGVVLLLATTVGTLVAGGVGAAWGFGIASVLGQPVWAFAYRTALRGVVTADPNCANDRATKTSWSVRNHLRSTASRLR